MPGCQSYNPAEDVPSPAEELRAAAAKLRETGKRATPGPWLAPDFSLRHGHADAAWIALMHPGRAELLAALLERIGDDMHDELADERDFAHSGRFVCDAGAYPRDDWTAALALARVINAERPA